MGCSDWRDDWVARIYGELGSEEARELEAHLEGCAACRDTLEGLEASRRMLRESAPVVPAQPRVTVLAPRSQWRTGWAFAAGLAAAGLIFFVGALAGAKGWTGALPGLPALTSPAALDELTTRLARLERDRIEPKPGPESGVVMTRAQFDQEMSSIEQRFERVREADFEYLLRTMALSEQRTGTRIERTQNALTYFALRNDPGLSEQ